MDKGHTPKKRRIISLIEEKGTDDLSIRRVLAVVFAILAVLLIVFDFFLKSRDLNIDVLKTVLIFSASLLGLSTMTYFKKQ